MYRYFYNDEGHILAKEEYEEVCTFISNLKHFDSPNSYNIATSIYNIDTRMVEDAYNLLFPNLNKYQK